MFGGDTLEVFRERLSRVLRGDLCLDSALTKRLAGEATIMLAEGREGAAERLRARLAEWDIDRQWAQVLRDEKAQSLAEWVEPYARGTVVDLLAKDGALVERLSQLGCPSVLVRRDGEKGLTNADTALFCDALSTAVGAEEALREVTRSSASRIVIVEAVVEEGSSERLHALFDLFFERCLGRPARGAVKRRSAEEWLAVAEKHGAVAALERWESLPGVPLPHALIAVDLDPNGPWLDTWRSRDAQ